MIDMPPMPLGNLNDSLAALADQIVFFDSQQRETMQKLLMALNKLELRVGFLEGRLGPQDRAELQEMKEWLAHV